MTLSYTVSNILRSGWRV